MQLIQTPITVKTVLLWLFPAWLAAGTAVPAPPPRTKSVSIKKSFFRLGSRVFQLEKQTAAADRSYVLVSLHNNERDLIADTRQFIAGGSGTFVVLENAGERNIAVELLDENIVLDPANIFSVNGRKDHLLTRAPLVPKLQPLLGQFAQFIYNELEPYRTIVELHNHSDNNLLQRYKARPRKFKWVKAFHEGMPASAENYLTTTDPALFEQLKTRPVNVLLLNMAKLKDAGDLASHCAKLRVPYVQLCFPEHDRSALPQLLATLEEVLHAE